MRGHPVVPSIRFESPEEVKQLPGTGDYMITQARNRVKEKQAYVDQCKRAQINTPLGQEWANGNAQRELSKAERELNEAVAKWG